MHLVAKKVTKLTKEAWTGLSLNDLMIQAFIVSFLKMNQQLQLHNSILYSAGGHNIYNLHHHGTMYASFFSVFP